MPCLCDRSSEVPARRTSCQLTRPVRQGPPRQQTRYPVARRFLLAGAVLGFAVVFKHTGFYVIPAVLLNWLIIRTQAHGHRLLLAGIGTVVGAYLAVMIPLFDTGHHDWYLQQSLVQIRRVLGLRVSRGTLASPGEFAHLLTHQYVVFVPSLAVALAGPATAVTRINVATSTAGRAIPVGSEARGLVVTPAAQSSPAGPIVSGYRSTKCAVISGGSDANDTPVVIGDCDGSPAQDWTIEAGGTIQAGGKCLDIYRDEKTNKAPVELWTCTGGANQQWHPTTAGTLVNPISGKCLDDPRFSTTPGTQLDLYTCTGGANQQWKIP